MSEEKTESETEPDYSTRFKPGQSGNPSGRPKLGQTWADIIRKVGDEETCGMTRKEKTVRKLYSLAEDEGDTRAVKILQDREEGTPIQQIVTEEVRDMEISRKIQKVEPLTDKEKAEMKLKDADA